MSAAHLIDDLIHQFQLKWGSPAISFAVGSRGNIIYKNAFSNTSAYSDEEVTTNHRFRVASVSKMFTSIAINKLIEDGALQHETLVFGENEIMSIEFYLGAAIILTTIILNAFLKAKESE